MSKLSIIIATYNSAPTLQKTLNSIYSQTWKDYEIIVVDGASKDSTCGILERNISRIKCLISEPDNGIYDALNKGIKKATGEWIFFLGSDDVFYNERVLEDVFTTTDIDKFDFVYGNVLFKNSGIIYDNKFYKLKMHFKNLCQQSIFYKSRLFEKFGCFNLKYKLWADYEFNLKCFGNSNIRKKYIKRIITIYNDEGISSRKEDEVFKADREILIKKYFGYQHYMFYLLRRLYQISRKKLISKICK